MPAPRFSRKIITWSSRYGRRDLPWQKNRTHYRVWVSEIMLQQTQVKTVIPYFQSFMERFPTLGDLAVAELDEVLQYWAGLGYYSRARYLHRTARIIHTEFKNKFPLDIKTLMSLPGIGRSTAGAILALCDKKRLPILDGNVKRILTRHRNIAGWPGTSSTNKQLWDLAEQLLPKKDIDYYTQGLMDLGAMICTRNNPQCDRCPVNTDCEARIAGTIDQRPERAPAKIKPVRSVAMLIVTHQHSVLLQRRPDQGIWGGLLCFPEIEQAQRAETWCRNHVGKVRHIHQWNKISHSFTHFTLNITPLHIPLHRLPTQVMEQSNYVWCKIKPRLAVPAPVKRLLIQLTQME